MAGATWDMITSGPDAGRIVQPLAYTTTEADSTRVRVWLLLATRLGTYRDRVNEGLDHLRILDPRTDDTEREALVRDVCESDEGVASVDSVEVVTDLAADEPSVSITAKCTTPDGATFTVGVTL